MLVFGLIGVMYVLFLSFVYLTMRNNSKQNYINSAIFSQLEEIVTASNHNNAELKTAIEEDRSTMYAIMQAAGVEVVERNGIDFELDEGISFELETEDEWKERKKDKDN